MLQRFRFECNSNKLIRLLLVLVPLLQMLLVLVPSVVLADPLGRSTTPYPGGRGVRPEAGGADSGLGLRPSS